MKREEIFVIAPCLKEGPLSKAGLNFIDHALGMSDGNYSGVLKTWATHYLFVRAEDSFKGNDDPTAAITSTLNELADLFAAASQMDAKYLGSLNSLHGTLDTIEAKEAETGDHYGNLFKAFDDAHYFEEAAELLGTRLSRNGVSLDQIHTWNVLDAGCGECVQRLQHLCDLREMGRAR